MPDEQSNYPDPKVPEAHFRQQLDSVFGGVRLELMTQIARAQGSQGQFDAAHKTLDKVKAAMGDHPIAEIRYLLERGRVYNSSGDAAQAVSHLQQAYDKAVAEKADFYAVDAAHMLGIATADSLAWTLKAIEIAEQSDNEGARDCLGSLYDNLGWLHNR